MVGEFFYPAPESILSFINGLFQLPEISSIFDGVEWGMICYLMVCLGVPFIEAFASCVPCGAC